jgi:DNA-binding transcriptional LysR family regulator
MSMLEAHVGYKLFNRKSKVEPTEYAKLLNNLIIEALDRLENVEMVLDLKPLMPMINNYRPVKAFIYCFGKCIAI